MKTFEVKLTDKDGLWGSLQVVASTPKSAKGKAIRALARLVRLNETAADIPTAKAEIVNS